MLYGALRSIKRTYFKKVYTDFVQPTLTENGTVGGDAFACWASSEINTNEKAWEAFRNSIESGYYWTSASNAFPAEIGWYNPLPLKISQVIIQNRMNQAPTFNKHELLASEDNSTWDIILSGDSAQNTGNSAINTLTVSEDVSAYKYWKFRVYDCVGQNNSTASIGRIQITAQEETITESEEPTEDYEDEVKLVAPLRSLERKYFKTETTIQDFVQPTLTEDGTWGGETFAVKGSSIYSTNYAWKAFRNSYTATTYFHSGNGLPQDLFWYNPIPLRISNIAITNRGIDGSCLVDYEIWASTDDADWQLVKSGSTSNRNLGGTNNVEISDERFFQFWKIRALSCTGGNNTYWACSRVQITAQERIEEEVEGTAEDFDRYEDTVSVSGFSDNKCKVTYYKDFVQPPLNANGTPGVDAFACWATTEEDNKEAWHAFNGVAGTDGDNWRSNTLPVEIGFYNPMAIKVSSIDFQYANSTTASINEHELLASNDGTDYVTVLTGGAKNFPNTGDSAVNTLTIPEGTDAYKYWKLNIKSVANGTAAILNLITIHATVPGTEGDYDFKEVDFFNEEETE